MFQKCFFSQPTITVGGGVTTEQALEVLHVLYTGGAKFGPQLLKSLSEIKSGEGPSRFYSCSVEQVRPEAHNRATVADVWKYVRDEKMTYEIGLRWFIADPHDRMKRYCGGINPYSDQAVVVIPAEPIMSGEKLMCLGFWVGGDGPYLDLWGLDLSSLFPSNLKFLVAWEAGYNPANPFEPRVGLK